MNELRIEVQEIIANELNRANESKPMFHSRHEGVEVIRKELWEAREETVALKGIIRDLELAIFRDKPDKELFSIARQALVSATLGACEMIQVAAMCDKFRMCLQLNQMEEVPEKPREESEFMQIPQEEIDRMVAELAPPKVDTERIKKLRSMMRDVEEQAKVTMRILNKLEEKL